MAELHLIGALAQDPDGPERLAALLADVRPDAVALESGPAAFEGRRSGGGAAREAALAVIREQGADPATLAFWSRRLDPARLHFEAFTAAAYATAHDLPFHFVAEDDPAEGPDGAAAAGGGADGGAEGFRQTDAQTLAALAGHDWPAAYRADYARARVDLEAKACLEFLLPLEAQPAFRARDRRMADRLAALLAGAEGEGGRSPYRLAFVCALTHLYFSEARLTVYSQLYEATTRRYLADGDGPVRDHPIVLPWSPA